MHINYLSIKDCKSTREKLTPTRRVGALTSFRMRPLTLRPAVNRHAATPLPLLSAGATGNRALRPGCPVQPLPLHCKHNHRETRRERERERWRGENRIRQFRSRGRIGKRRAQKWGTETNRKQAVRDTDRERWGTARGLCLSVLCEFGTVKMIVTYPDTNL